MQRENQSESREQRIMRLIAKMELFIWKCAHKHKGNGVSFEDLVQYCRMIVIEVADRFPDDDGAVVAYLFKCLPGRVCVEAARMRGISGQESFENVEWTACDIRTQYALEQVDLDMSLERSLNRDERRLLAARMKGRTQSEIGKRRKLTRQAVGMQEQKLRKKLLAILVNDTPESPKKRRKKGKRATKTGQISEIDKLN